MSIPILIFDCSLFSRFSQPGSAPGKSFFVYQKRNRRFQTAFYSFIPAISAKKSLRFFHSCHNPTNDFIKFSCNFQLFIFNSHILCYVETMKGVFYEMFH